MHLCTRGDLHIDLPEALVEIVYWIKTAKVVVRINLISKVSRLICFRASTPFLLRVYKSPQLA